MNRLLTRRHVARGLWRAFTFERPARLDLDTSETYYARDIVCIEICRADGDPTCDGCPDGW